MYPTKTRVETVFLKKPIILLSKNDWYWQPKTFTDATHTYDIILNTDTISILIPCSQWWAKNCERKIFQKKESNSVYYFRDRIWLYCCGIVERRTNLMISISHGLLNLQATIPSAISRFVMLLLCQFPTIYRTRDGHANHYISNAVLCHED
jgi:hypothetical protein